jgi:hypothetical protein
MRTKMGGWLSIVGELPGRTIGHVLQPQAPFRLTRQTLAEAFVYSYGAG